MSGAQGACIGQKLTRLPPANPFFKEPPCKKTAWRPPQKKTTA